MLRCLTELVVITNNAYILPQSGLISSQFSVFCLKYNTNFFTVLFLANFYTESALNFTFCCFLPFPRI
jgi:hypothetical protein